MCGIAGIIGEFPDGKVRATLQRMLDAQVHRGPDDEGMAVIQIDKSSLGLGNRRLAILDISPLGHQPMTNPDTGDVLVYNGEVYNSPELRESLKVDGFTFRGLSDTEVLLRAYEKWGVECLNRLKGMYAFAIWDNRKRSLLLARDHLGIKPLYYASVPTKGFVWASEIRALLASGLIPFALDQAALAGYLAYGGVQEPLTIVRGAFALPPGSWMEVNEVGELVVQGVYWRIPLPNEDNLNASLKGVVEEGRTLLSESVKRHLLSDVPVGIFLSSGLDSTAVLGLAHEAASSEVHAFTVSFPDAPALDELSIARATARNLDVVHHVCLVSSKTALDWTLKGLECMDQPVMDGINTYIVSRAVREQGVKVALSGQGGDEIFGGYRSFRGVERWHRRLRWLRYLPPGVREFLAQLATITVNSVARGKVRDIARTEFDIPSLYFQYRRLIPDDDLKRFGLGAEELGLTMSYHQREPSNGSYLLTQDAIAAVRLLESTYYMSNILLRDGDVFGMANSLEIRVPFLDKDLVDWAFRLPSTVLLPHGSPDKFLLRQMCADFYTPVLARQNKRGFTPPFSAWLLGPLRDLMEECLGAVINSELLTPEGVNRIRTTFLRQPQTAAWSRVWGLVTLGYWLKKHKDAGYGSVA